MDFEETDLSQSLIIYSSLRQSMNIPFWQEHTIDKRLQMAIWTTLFLLLWANNCFNEVALMPNHEGEAQPNHPKPKVVIYIRLCSTNNWFIINKSIKQANSATYWSIYLAVNYLWAAQKVLSVTAEIVHFVERFRIELALFQLCQSSRLTHHCTKCRSFRLLICLLVL